MIEFHFDIYQSYLFRFLLKRKVLWSRNLSFYINSQGICACIVSNFHPGSEKNVDYSLNSTRYTELKCLHVTAMSFWREVYHLAEMNFQLSIPSQNFNLGWKSTYNQPLKAVVWRCSSKCAFVIFTGKQQCWSLFLKKLQAFRSTYRKSGTQDPKVGPSSIKFFFPFPLLKSRAAFITEMKFK